MLPLKMNLLFLSFPFLLLLLSLVCKVHTLGVLGITLAVLGTVISNEGRVGNQIFSLTDARQAPHH